MKPFISCIILYVISIGCASANDGNSSFQSSVVLEGYSVGLIFEDIPNSFWANAKDKANLAFSFFLLKNGELVKDDSIKNFKITSHTGKIWKAPVPEDERVYDGHFRFVTNEYSPHRDVLSLQSYKIDLDMKNGAQMSFSISPRDILRQFGIGSELLASADYANEGNSPTAKFFSRPKIEMVSIVQNSLHIRFTCEDVALYKVDTYLYDKSKTLLGELVTSSLDAQTSIEEPTAKTGKDQKEDLEIAMPMIHWEVPSTAFDVAEYVVISVSVIGSTDGSANRIIMQSKSEMCEIGGKT